MSLTISSLFVGAVIIIADKAGVTIAPEALQTTAETIALIISALGVWYGRFRHGDVTWFGAKKEV